MGSLRHLATDPGCEGGPASSSSNRNNPLASLADAVLGRKTGGAAEGLLAGRAPPPPPALAAHQALARARAWAAQCHPGIREEAMERRGGDGGRGGVCRFQCPQHPGPSLNHPFPGADPATLDRHAAALVGGGAGAAAAAAASGTAPLPAIPSAAGAWAGEFAHHHHHHHHPHPSSSWAAEFAGPVAWAAEFAGGA